MENCDYTIRPGLSSLFLYAPVHKIWPFEKFIFELEANFKIDCILLRQLIIFLKKIFSFHALLSVLL